MMYSEFLEGTKAKDTPKNYEVFLNLEKIYMESETLTKSDIYEAGKKLVDNSETPAEKATRERIETIKNEIEELEADNELYNSRIEIYFSYIEIETDPEQLKAWKQGVTNYKNEIKKNKRYIKRQKSLMKMLAI